MHDSGFIVEKDNIAEFLEYKLKVLGLNYKEREEFIIYWLPKLRESKYNYIYFEYKNVNDIYNIEINPKPDTFIRVLMEYKPLNKKINIKEQELTKQT